MAGEEELFELLEDLEAQAESLGHLERAAEVADRTRAEYGAITLDSRLMASLGDRVEVDVVSSVRLQGEVGRVGPGWFQLVGTSSRWWIRTEAVTGVRGASPRAVPEVAWSAVQRLGLGSVLRRLADEAEPVVTQLLDGTRHEGRVVRVGADFLELETIGGEGSVVLVPLARVAHLRADG